MTVPSVGGAPSSHFPDNPLLEMPQGVLVGAPGVVRDAGVYQVPSGFANRQRLGQCGVCRQGGSQGQRRHGGLFSSGSAQHLAQVFPIVKWNLFELQGQTFVLGRIGGQHGDPRPGRHQGGRGGFLPFPSAAVADMRRPPLLRGANHPDQAPLFFSGALQTHHVAPADFEFDAGAQGFVRNLPEGLLPALAVGLLALAVGPGLEYSRAGFRAGLDVGYSPGGRRGWCFCIPCTSWRVGSVQLRLPAAHGPTHGGQILPPGVAAVPKAGQGRLPDRCGRPQLVLCPIHFVVPLAVGEPCVFADRSLAGDLDDAADDVSGEPAPSAGQ